MSEATRSAALLHAVAVHAGDGHEVVLKAAKAFDAFISASNEVADKPKATTKPSAAPPPAAKKKTAPPADDEDGDEEAVVAKTVKRKAAAADADEDAEGDGEEVTQEAVETAIADLLGANLRKQVVALLGEYGAKSASGVKASDRAEFISRASDLMLGS